MSEPNALAKIVAFTAGSMADMLMAPDGLAQGERFIRVERAQLERLNAGLRQLYANPDHSPSFNSFAKEIEAHLTTIESHLRVCKRCPEHGPIFLMAAGVSMSVVYNYLKLAMREYNIPDTPESAAA